MAHTSPIEPGIATVSATGYVSLDGLSASTFHAHHAQAYTLWTPLHWVSAGTSVPRVSDRSGWELSWLQLPALAAYWEVALVAVLFLLIGGLVAFRITEVLSRRDVEDRFRSLISEPVGESGEPNHSRIDGHRANGWYLSPDTPPELLSDEGKVVKLLVANDGRIRQHRIADETGWSKSKVSRICSRMHDSGTIAKESVGRENVISLSEPDWNANDDGVDLDDVGNPIP